MPEAGKGKLVVSIQPLGLERPGFGVVAKYARYGKA
jgi:hypothetical protein